MSELSPLESKFWACGGELRLYERRFRELRWLWGGLLERDRGDLDSRVRIVWNSMFIKSHQDRHQEAEIANSWESLMYFGILKVFLRKLEVKIWVTRVDPLLWDIYNTLHRAVYCECCTFEGCHSHIALLERRGYWIFSFLGLIL